MEVKLRDRLAPDVEEFMKHSPDENLVFRCLKCQSFILPREINILKIPSINKWGQKTFYTVPLCPTCFPDPQNYVSDDRVEPSEFMTLTREQFFITRKYEKSGLLAPDFVGSTTQIKSSLIS
ncbi:MAG: hypothetical protein PHS34_08775 [Candidatus Omnitrophica bacterium]|nr:hypothetical protein [Candidatus Omnitrophota bacterium]